MKKQSIDLNSDMGEGFGIWRAGEGRDDEIMAQISSANVATGFHAGDPNIMNHTVQQAKLHGVGVGAHPAFRDLVGFGRRHINAAPEELINDIIYQVGALQAFLRRHNLPLQHVKPHGALYMALAKDENLSEMFVRAVQEIAPEALIFCMDISATYRVAKALGQPVVREFYGDRHYDESGSIVFTRNVGALSADEVAQKVLTACTEGRVKTVSGQWIDIEFDSICIHSDTQGALGLITTTRQLLEANGITVTNRF